VPGALSNQPPVPATAPLTAPPAPGTPGAPAGATAPAGTAPAAAPTTTAVASAASGRRDATTNYELDKTIRHVRQPVGAIKRLSTAVVVNHRKETASDGKVTLKPLSTKEMAQINDLVKEAMGYNKDRGDTLNVQNSPFASSEKQEVPETPIWKNPTVIGWVLEGLKYLVFAGLAAYLLFGVVRPFLRKLMERAATIPESPGEMAYAAEGGRGGAIGYEQKLQSARDMARQEPKAVATVIKDWVGGNQPAGKVQ
jgi:flagellar M-ring protein FliF